MRRIGTVLGPCNVRLVLALRSGGVFVFMDSISWNVWCLGQPEKRRAISKLVKKLKRYFLFLQESKVRAEDYRLVNAFGGRILTKGMIVYVIGSYGGLISLWNEDVFTAKERVALWEFLVANQRKFTVPWIVGGKGELVTCSKQQNSELFYGVLGGLGQFGIITRARIILEPANPRVKWYRLLYTDFVTFSEDQETLMAVNESSSTPQFPNYLEGQLLMDPNSLDVYPPEDRPRIASLIKQYGILYVLETATYYDVGTKHSVDKKLHQLFKSLSSLPNIYTRDVTYVEFLNRVHTEELILRQKGLWDVPHPWLNLFIPKSGIQAFNNGVFKNILLKQNFTTSIVLVYPMYRNKWDDNMSAVIPDEEIFYTAGFLDASGFDNWKVFDNKNKEILEFCDKGGIKVKKYLGYHDSKEEWINHFGSKWKTFLDRKNQYDPKMILSPGQKIFN
ncbi:hypothetical protein LWI28_003615 [Acer negundo]|uniref:Cytokinin dehydrogenase 1 FAD/cytokinin binding domain-containing protein n=1 Tax=Acer negundo TaxID=4023 RepID=A0AAD5NXB8_ACENE|nr:hypothetical protein LWI28_003615 [Acer negundo]